MTGKFSSVEKNIKNDDKLNSYMGKITSSKSILSYQNGSAVSMENHECTDDKSLEGYSEETSMPNEPFSESQDLKSECLDLLRKKLISDLSLSVFSSDLENKLTKMEPIEIGKERQSVVQKLVVQISQLSDAEKLLLYLKLPSSTSSPFDPLRQPLNPLGNRQEIQQTIVWIKTHLEEDSEISIPKQDVYDQYLKYCENVSMKPLSTADFGKVMKQVYPGVRPRRLGTRGNSRYCYSGMRNTCKLPTPVLPKSTIENSISNSNSNDGLSFLSAEGNKLKKLDKAKRKWTSPTCRSDKFASSRSSCLVASDKNSTCQLKTPKRLKSLENDETECTNTNSDEKFKEEIDLEKVKCEEVTENSFCAFDVEFGISNALVNYLKKEEEHEKNLNFENNREVTSNSENERKPNGFGESVLQKNEPSQKALITEQHNNGVKIRTISKEDQVSLDKRDQTAKANVSINQITNTTPHELKREKNLILDKPKATKVKVLRKSASLTKNNKSSKKCYVPIQPKPVEGLKFCDRFEKNQIFKERRKEVDGTAMCEESDSQEPEEEIVRYFKHLDEKELNTANKLVDEAVKFVDTNSVQISNISQVVSNSKHQINYSESEDFLDHVNQQILRSQSCFEVQRGCVGISEKNDSVYLPRSQSSVELPTSNEHVQQDGSNLELDDKKKKISHLRILLERSISSDPKSQYPSLKNHSIILPKGNVEITNTPNSVSDPISPVTANESNILPSDVKFVDRRLLKLNGLKVLSRGPSFASESPTTRTKYFSFTPISPGPQSPLKTSSASPFLSPRNTPVPRSKQTSQGDCFLFPLDRKSGPSRSEGPKSEVLNDSVCNYSKTLVGNSNFKNNASPVILQNSRPRSYSTTNFYKSKARRNSSKPFAFERTINPSSKANIQLVTNANFTLNSSFSFSSTGSNFVSSESLSTEVQKLLENNSKLGGGQVATIRSRSVPLNRMISENTWSLPNQVCPMYSGFGNTSTVSESDKLSGLVPDSNDSSAKTQAPNLSSFVTSEEISTLESTTSLSGEIFSADSIAQINEKFFVGDFQRANDEAFGGDQAFNETSDFSSKLDLNSSGTFDGAFAGDSDPVIADNIKSYIPDFEGLDNKNLVESASVQNDIQNDRKLFKNALYEGSNDNLKDPVITSFKPVLMNELSSSPGSPVLNFLNTKINEESQQLIEFFNFED